MLMILRCILYLDQDSGITKSVIDLFGLYIQLRGTCSSSAVDSLDDPLATPPILFLCIRNDLLAGDIIISEPSFAL